MTGSSVTVLAHGGTGGAIVEVLVLVVPVVAFVVLSRWSKRRDQADRDAAAGGPVDPGDGNAP